tara:strand:+ start:11641 stop:12069 length:429 start_codon:yes stop_codon:yes gene_type:complete
MIGIIIIIILLLTLILSITNFFRVRNVKIEQQKNISLMDLAEFDNLSPKIKEIYKLYILDSWMKFFNDSLNNSFKINGLDAYYANNKDKLIELNNLYLELAELSMEKNNNLLDDSFKVFVYNADLDKLIEEAKKMKSQMQIK